MLKLCKKLYEEYDTFCQVLHITQDICKNIVILLQVFTMVSTACEQSYIYLRILVVHECMQ